MSGAISDSANCEPVRQLPCLQALIDFAPAEDQGKTFEVLLLERLDMRDNIFYIRGPIPFGLSPGITEAMVRDAKLLLELSEEQLDQVRNRLAQQPGFVERHKLEGLLTEVLSDAKLARRLAKFVDAIADRLRKFEQTVEDLTRQFEGWLDGEENKASELLTRDQFEQLRTRFPYVLASFPCLERQAKAEELTKTTGQPLESLNLICDVRPIFDQDRDCVEGMLPLTTLRVVCTGADGLPVACEALLSESQLDELVDKAQKAKKKLIAIRRHLTEHRMEIPLTQLTRQGKTNAK